MVKNHDHSKPLFSWFFHNLFCPCFCFGHSNRFEHQHALRGALSLEIMHPKIDMFTPQISTDLKTYFHRSGWDGQRSSVKHIWDVALLSSFINPIGVISNNKVLLIDWFIYPTRISFKHLFRYCWAYVVILYLYNIPLFFILLFSCLIVFYFLSGVHHRL